MKSTGEFDSLLRFVFQPKSQARFEWQKWTEVRGRPAHVRRYRATTAARGLVYVDAETHKLLRLTTEAENIPEKWPVRALATELDYDFTEIAGEVYLLPKRYGMRLSSTDGQRRNVTEFGNYRRFSAEATVNFEK